MPETSCRFYVTEDLELDLIHCSDTEFGFCYLKGFMESCCGKCKDYDCYDGGNEEEDWM